MQQALAMAAVALLSQLAHCFSFLRQHPKLSFLLLLLLSPPIYRVLLYFTPLLLSTALCIFALITLAPYVTATDAEVERQSLLGASSHQRKANSCSSTGKGESKGKSRENTSPSLSSASSSAASLSDPSGSAPCPSASASLSSAAENSWMSWMKGLNDIGRAWVESKLAEQGLALSEPADRETLLALIEDSFAELLTVKEDYTDVFPVGGKEVDEVGGKEVDVNVTVMHLKDTNDESRSEEFVMPQLKSRASDDIECSADHVVDVNVVKEACVDAPLPISVSDIRVDDVVASIKEKEVRLVNADDGAGSLYECSTEEHALDSNASLDSEGYSSKHNNVHPVTDVVKEKPAACEHTLPMIDAALEDVVPTNTIMPKTPSRIPAPSKLFEASRRIFLKEDQSKSMLPRAPFQLSGRLQPSKPNATSAAQSKVESSHTSIMSKLPTRRFLERTKSTSVKEGSKFSSSSLMEKQRNGKDDECGVAQGKEKVESNVGIFDANDNDNDLASVEGDLPHEANANGPKFDEDLEVEEAQALVQSELKMLEVELEEVAAKLPKVDEALAYQKTPVKMVTSAATMSSPTLTSRSSIALFSAASFPK